MDFLIIYFELGMTNLKGKNSDRLISFRKEGMCPHLLFFLMKLYIF